MLSSKKLLAFTASLPAVYLITAIILDAVVFSNPDPAPFDIFLQQYSGVISVFELIVLAVSLALTYALVEKSRIREYKVLVRCSPYINILIGLFLFVNFWFVGIAVAFVCALITPVCLYLQRK